MKLSTISETTKCGLNNLCSSPNIVSYQITISTEIFRAYSTNGDVRNAYKILIIKSGGNAHLRDQA